jgi:hypothetical protein
MTGTDNDLQKKLDQGIVESTWTESGELSYVIQNGLNVEDYARIIKAMLESQNEIAHDFWGTVTNESKTSSARFQYKSGWFLEGLANGDIL